MDAFWKDWQSSWHVPISFFSFVPLDGHFVSYVQTTRTTSSSSSSSSHFYRDVLDARQLYFLSLNAVPMHEDEEHTLVVLFFFLASGTCFRRHHVEVQQQKKSSGMGPLLADSAMRTRDEGRSCYYNYW